MTQTDIKTQAQIDWECQFRTKVADVEADYHFWQNAEDRRRLNTHAEEQTRLNHEATVKQNRHTDHMRHLIEWVQAHPYPEADQAPKVADALAEANRLANLAEEKQQYRNGWDDAMAAVEDVQGRQEDARLWANRVQIKVRTKTEDPYVRGTVDALTHFLQTGETERHMK